MKKDYSMGLLGAMFWSIPFYFIWNKLAPTYFYWLPPVYQNLPFWVVGQFEKNGVIARSSPNRGAMDRGNLRLWPLL